MVLTDFYKTIHHLAYVPKLDYLVSIDATKSRYENQQNSSIRLTGGNKEYLINEFNTKFFNRPYEEIETEYKRIIANTMSVQAADTTEIKKLHKLGCYRFALKRFLKERSKHPTPFMKYPTPLKDLDGS